jgi:hypothetical protein
MMEYNLSLSVAKTYFAYFRGQTLMGPYGSKGLHCSPFLRIMAAAFSLNTGQISKSVFPH